MFLVLKAFSVAIPSQRSPPACILQTLPLDDTLQFVPLPLTESLLAPPMLIPEAFLCFQGVLSLFPA